MIRHNIYPELFKKAKLINSETFFIGLTIVSLITSLYLISVGMIALTIISIFYKKWEKEIFLKYLPILGLSLIFLVSFLFGIGGDDHTFWLGRIRIHLPFLILPLVFLSLAPISKELFVSFHVLLILVLVIVLIGSILYYGFNFESVQQDLKEGRSVPVPVNHIRLSLMLVYGILMAWWIRDQSEKGKTILFLSIIFMIIGLHYVAARNGLFAFYILFLIEAYRKFRGYSLFLLMIPILLFLSVPSFKAKIGYTIFEIKKTINGQGSGYSSGDRWDSIKDGWKLFKENPFFGVGTADLKMKMKELNPNKQRLIMPHNQWVNVLAASGIVGAFLFFAGYFAPLIIPEIFNFLPVRWLYGILTLSMLFESTLDTSDAVGFFLIFLLISVNFKRYDFSHRR